jgi:hypothetical protein
MPAQALPQKTRRNFAPLSGARYLFVIYSEGVKRLLWRMA